MRPKQPKRLLRLVSNSPDQALKLKACVSLKANIGPGIPATFLVKIRAVLHLRLGGTSESIRRRSSHTWQLWRFVVTFWRPWMMEIIQEARTLKIIFGRKVFQISDMFKLIWSSTSKLFAISGRMCYLYYMLSNHSRCLHIVARQIMCLLFITI